jgi:hypothetical protein
MQLVPSGHKNRFGHCVDSFPAQKPVWPPGAALVVLLTAVPCDLVQTNTYIILSLILFHSTIMDLFSDLIL